MGRIRGVAVGVVLVMAVSATCLATAGASTATGGAADGRAALLFVRETDTGVTVRAHRGPFPPMLQLGYAGTSYPGTIPIGVVSACPAVGTLLVGLSTTESVGQGASGLPDLPRAEDLAFVGAGSFGAPEGSPTVWAAVQVSKEVALVRARFDGGRRDEMEPVQGVAVVASPVRGSFGRNADRTGPIGKLVALDADGKVVDRMRFGPTRSFETGIPDECTSGSLGGQLPKRTGPPPKDEDAAREEVTNAFTTLYNAGPTRDQRLAVLEDGEELGPTYDRSVEESPEYAGRVSIRVDEVRFVNRRAAGVRFGLMVDGSDVLTDQIGRATLEDGRWLVARPTFCTLLSFGGYECPGAGEEAPNDQQLEAIVTDTRLLVLNGSPVADADGLQANNLRGLGYPIAGTGEAPSQAGTTVACTPGFEDAAAPLAAALGPTAVIVPFPSPAPVGAENADCIVTLGA